MSVEAAQSGASAAHVRARRHHHDLKVLCESGGKSPQTGSVYSIVVGDKEAGIEGRSM
jgi:hypothetical protein